MAGPEGIDVYFDNVGGDHLDAALASAKTFGRFALCGIISDYNAASQPNGSRNIFCWFGQAWRETDIEDTDLETVIEDLLDGQYSNSIRVIGFNTAEGWSRDVSEDLVEALCQRCADQAGDLPALLEQFVERYQGRHDGIATGFAQFKFAICPVADGHLRNGIL